MSDFLYPVDIANRALQHLGATQIVSFTDNSRNASAMSFAYDKLRKAELRRNIWTFSVRRVTIRPLATTTMLLVPYAWNTTNSYLPGSIVSYGGLWYQANQAVAANGTSPDQTSPIWTLYFGPKQATPFTGQTATSPGVTYNANELVYDPSGNVYLSLTNGNSQDPTAGQEAWSATTTYNAGQTVVESATTYQSTVDLNLNSQPPSANWEAIPATQIDTPISPNWLKLGGATVKSIQLIYPLDVGPLEQVYTRNVFYLPNGFIREAPQDPTAGSNGFLGAPSGLGYTDYTFERDFFTSIETSPITYRFAADVAEVSWWDNMFCEGLAARLALETCEQITQSTEKMQGIMGMYGKFMGEARIVNGIEQRASEPPEDAYITCRF